MHRVMAKSNVIRTIIVLSFSLSAFDVLYAGPHDRNSTFDPMAGLPPDSTRLKAIPLGEGDEPSISPDGRRIAYTRYQTTCPRSILRSVFVWGRRGGHSVATAMACRGRSLILQKQGGTQLTAFPFWD